MSDALIFSWGLGKLVAAGLCGCVVLGGVKHDGARQSVPWLQLLQRSPGLWVSSIERPANLLVAVNS